MKIPIDQIQIDETTRIRKEIGNLAPLEASIQEVGLINPVLIDEQRNLLAGYRRLSACRNLGWKEVEVKVVELSGDQLKMLDVEIAENFFRKDFTPEEILSTEKRRLEILEELREKSIFERFWLWLKQLFSGKPENTEKAEKVVAPPPSPANAETVAPVRTESGAKQVEETEEAAADNEGDKELPKKAEPAGDKQ